MGRFLGFFKFFKKKNATFAVQNNYTKKK